MPVIAIRAYIECEGCGVEFSVAIEETTAPPQGWSMYDVAVDAVRGGLDYKQAADRRYQSLDLTCVEDGKMLCADCTYEADQREEQRYA